ncbi:unnamed protein product [Callosobruchus maculatus]|uniref:PWWP domain-containing protein n=1 Tax=Callosobruchus maculatus TaxID=64391 RepID=A0A653BXA9_CALMS|nr:unnamed protein product [Callosobruchus maculatus]
MKRSYPSHISPKKQKKLPNIYHNSQSMKDHPSSERSIKQTEQTQKSTKRKGRQLLTPQDSLQKQELQFSTDIQHLDQAIHKNGGFGSNSPNQKDCPYEVLKSLRFYSPKSSYGGSSLKPTLENEDDVASTSFSPIHAPHLLVKLPESKSMFRKTYGKRKDNDNLNSLKHSNESILSSTRNHVLDVPIENSLDVTIEEPSEFNVWIIDDSDLIADIRHVPLNFGVKIEEGEFGVDIEDFEGCNINAEAHHLQKSSNIKANVYLRDTSDFVILDAKTDSARPTKQVKNICGSSTACYGIESSVKFNDNENNMLSGDVEIEIANTCYSPDDTEPSAAVNEKTILKNTNNMNSGKLNDPYVASNIIETSLMLKNEETNDSLFVTPSSRRYTKERQSILRSSLTITSKDMEPESTATSNNIIKTTLPVEHSFILQTPGSNMYTRKSTLRSGNSGTNKNRYLKTSSSNSNTSLPLCDATGSTKGSVEPEQSGPFIASSCIKRTSLELDENNLPQTSSINLCSRKSTLRSRTLMINHNEDLEGKIVDTCLSSGDNDDVALGNDSSGSPNDGIKSQTLPKSFITPKSSKISPLRLQDDFSLHTLSLNKDRKSTLRSNTKRNEDLNAKCINTCSDNNTNTSVTLNEVTTPSTTVRSVGPEHQYHGKDDSLFLSPPLSKHIKKFIMPSKVEASGLNKLGRTSTLRSRSLEVKKSHNSTDRQRNILSRSMSCIDQYEGFLKESRSLVKKSDMNLKNKYEKSDDAIILNNDEFDSKKLMDKKILKVVVVPMETMIRDDNLYDDIQNIESEPSSSLGDNTSENNNLVEPNLTSNSMNNSLLSSKEEQNCNTDIICTQSSTKKSTDNDEKFVNDILKSGVNQSLLGKNSRKKTDERASSDFISPRLKAKQLQQMGLISEDTSFAFYSTVDSVLAEIKVSQKQQKLSGQNKKQHAEVDERIIKGHTHAPNVTKEQTLSVCVHDVITRIIENVAISACNQNEDCHEDSGVTRNKRSRRKLRPLNEHQNSSQRVNSNSLNTQVSFGKLTEGHQELCKNSDTALLQNGIIGFEYSNSRFDSTCNNQLVKRHDTAIGEENEQKSVGTMSLEILNESKDAEDPNADSSNNKKTSQLQESECVETQKSNIKQKSFTKRRGRKMLLTQLNGESTSKNQNLSQDFETVQGIVTTVTNNVLPTRHAGRPRTSGVSSTVKSEDSIVSMEQGSEVCNNTHVLGNNSIKRKKSRPRKSKVFTERLPNNGHAIEDLHIPEITSEKLDTVDKVSTKRKINNSAILPIGSSNDADPGPFKNITLATEDIITPRRRGRPRKSEVLAVCQSNHEKDQLTPEKHQTCKVTTDKLKEKLILPKESIFMENKSSRTFSTVKTDEIIVTKELESYHIAEINNEVCKLRETSPKARMTRARSQETIVKSQLHITDALVPAQDNTPMEKNLNSRKSKIEGLSSKGGSSGHRKSGKLRETRVKNIDLVENNILDSLQNVLSESKQSETLKNRRGRSEGRLKTIESTPMTCSSEQESKNTSELSRSQTDNDLQSSIGITDEVLNKKSTSIGASSTLFEQNSDLISPKGHRENSLNNDEKQSVELSDIETLPSKQEKLGHRKLGRLRETQVKSDNSIEINISHSLEDMLKSPKQCETPKGRRGRSETAEPTLIKVSSELESKSTADISRSQIEKDLDSAIGVGTNGVPASTDAQIMVSEQNEDLIRINGPGESFDSNIASENNAKSVAKWMEEHMNSVGAANSDNGMVSVTNSQKIPNDKLQTDKEWNTRRSLTRGRKLVAMIQEDVNNACAVKDIKDGNTRNSALEESSLDSKTLSKTVKAAGANAEIEETSSLNRHLTRGSMSMLEQQKLEESVKTDENQMKELEKALLLNESEERYVTEIGTHGTMIEVKSADNAEENINRQHRRSRRRSSPVLREEEDPTEDTLEDAMGCKGDSTDSEWSQMGAETDEDEEIMQPEKHCRPVTSIGNRKKRRRYRSMSWSARKSRSRSKCPSEGDMSSYKHGDLIWAQIGSYPYWPCMVTYAPDTREVKRTCNMGRGIRTVYHVQFFGDRGRRAWINVTKTMPFNSSNDLKAMVDRLEAEEGGYNMFYQPFMFKSSREVVNKRLQVAASEAESLKLKTIEDKQKFFEDAIKNVIERNAVGTRQASSVRSGKSKRRSKDLDTLPPSKIVKATHKSGTRRSIRIESMEGANETMQDREEEKEVEKKDTPIAPKIVRPPLVIPPLEELYSIEAQKALFKRNNLFKGVSKYKVCHFCLEPGDVFRCSAKCSGIYHLECSVLVMNNKIGGKRQASLKYSPSAKSEDEERCARGEVDDHVQIVTVPSCIYNTPPRRNFPPDFGNLTLAEQIDYKMKEVMRKFESKNIYANESRSASSNSSSDRKSEVVIRHVAADSVIEEHVAKLKKPGKNHVAVKLFARPEDVGENVTFKTTNTSLVKRHVTADDISFEMLPTDSKNFKCGFCLRDAEPNCFVCHESVSPRGSQVRQKCSLYHCGRFFHPCCLKMWPQTQWSIIQLSKSKNVSDSFVCPQHVCHTCVSDDPRAATSRCSCDKIVKCMLCPRSYHSSNLCIPAGTKILSTSQIVCPGHRKKSNSLCINTTWCFLCSEGGNLICCETCPTSVHPECLPVSLTEDGKFICEDCESGRLPLYDEIVWVKLGHFRWWPAVILFPNEVPPNVQMVKHSIGDFVVRFFGTYNYYWVNRGRSFLFQDGDTGDGNNKVKKLDKEFKKAVEEATLAHKLKQAFKNTQQVESPNSQKPPPYIKIKVNKPVGNVRQLDLDLSNTTACNCDPNQKNPCGPDSDCLNRLLMTECNPEVCPAGIRCRNQSFEKREYPPLVAYKTQARGWGLKTLMPIKKGQFVIEYVGEIIDTEEYQRRIQKMHEQKEENYYFLTIDNQRMLDAGPKGNLARFMNHCCQPNCETQKWTVNGETRVGLFATVDIPAETELTFNYNLECVGKEKKVCRCGAPNCSGFIGVKAKQDDLARPAKLVKRVYKKKQKKLVEPVVSQPCFICSRTGNVITCNNKMCNKVYHKKCLKLDINNFDASRFVCPWHNCDICSKRTIRCCVKCIRSYCPQHSDGRIRHDGTAGYICYKHDSIRRAIMGKNIKTIVASTSMSVLFLTVSVNLYFLCKFLRSGFRRTRNLAMHR